MKFCSWKNSRKIPTEFYLQRVLLQIPLSNALYFIHFTKHFFFSSICWQSEKKRETYANGLEWNKKNMSMLHSSEFVHIWWSRRSASFFGYFGTFLHLFTSLKKKRWYDMIVSMAIKYGNGKSKYEFRFTWHTQQSHCNIHSKVDLFKYSNMCGILFYVHWIMGRRKVHELAAIQMRNEYALFEVKWFVWLHRTRKFSSNFCQFNITEHLIKTWLVILKDS